MGRYITTVTDLFINNLSFLNSVNINQNGFIQKFNKKIDLIDIDSEERLLILSHLDSQMKDYSIIEFIKNFNFNIILDGANIGYYGKNKLLNYSQIECCRLKLIDMGYNPLIVLHQRHFILKNLNQENRYILKKWENAKCYFKTPFRENDDIYWLYLAINKNIPVVTNDKLRDHHFELIQNLKKYKLKISPFKLWISDYVLNYEFTNNLVKIKSKPNYSIKFNLLKKMKKFIVYFLKKKKRMVCFTNLKIF